jgi:O-antigen/teichoic acid export membrane protein
VTASLEKSTLARNTVWSALGYGVQFVTPVVMIPYTLSKVSDASYGGWVALYTLATWVSYYDLGLWGSLTRDVAERQARQDRDGLRGIWATWFAFDVLVGIGLILAAVLLGPEILRRAEVRLDPGLALQLFVGLTAQFVLTPMHRHLTYTIHGLQRLDLTNGIAILATPLWAAAQVAFLELGWGLKGLMINGLLFMVLQILVLIVLIRRLGYPISFRPRHVSSAELRRMIGFGWKLQAGTLVNQAFRSDRLVLNKMQANAAMVTVYQLGAGIMITLAGAVSVLSSGILSAVSDLAARGDRERVKLVFLRGTKYHALAGVGLLGFAALFGRELMVFWMGRTLDESVVVLRIMALGGIATCIGSCGQSVGIALGRPGWAAVSSVAGLAATVFLYMTVGRGYDYVGLAASVSMGLALIQVVFMIGLRGFLEFRWREYVGNALLKPAVLAVPLAGVYAGWSALAPHLPPVETRLRAFLVLAPAFLVTAALGWAMARIFRVVDDYDLGVLKSPGQRPPA